MPGPARYWALPPEGYDGEPPTRAAPSSASRFASAVRVHARSDVPVGTCLSGGLDSSSIVCVADRAAAARRDPPATRTAASATCPTTPATPSGATWRRWCADRDRDDLRRGPAASASARRWPRSRASRTSPSAPPASRPSASSSRRPSAGGMKVMLDGQGADEVLGGYHHYFPLIGPRCCGSRRSCRYARFVARTTGARYGAPPSRRRAALATRWRRSARAAAPRRLAVEPPAAALLARARALGGRDRPALPPEFDSVHELLAAHHRRSGCRRCCATRTATRWRTRSRRGSRSSTTAWSSSPSACPRVQARRRRDQGGAARGDARACCPSRSGPARTRSGSAPSPPPPGPSRAPPRVAARQPHRATRSAGSTARRSPPVGRRPLGTDAEFMLWRLINIKLWARTFWGDADAVID